MKNSIRKEIFLLIIFSVTIPLLIVSIVTYKVSLHAVEQEYQSNSAIILNNLSLNFDQYLQGIEKGTLLAYMDSNLQASLQARMQSDGNFDDIANRKVIEDFVRRIEIMIRNVNGVQIFSENRVFYAGSYDLVGADYDYSYKNSDWYKKTIENDGGKVLFGTHKPFQRKFSNDYVISMSRAIRSVNDHKILGVMLLDIRLDMLEEIFSLTEHEKRNFIMLDEKGDVIFSSKYLQNTSRLHMQNTAIEKILKNKTGNLSTVIDNQNVYLNYVTSKYSGWKVIQYINHADMVRNSATVGKIIFFVAIASALFATIVMFFISTRVSQPIIQLSKQIELVGSGKFSYKLDSRRKDEIGKLIRGFNRMVTDLQHYIERVAAAKAKQKEAQFIALQSQINPHFLANTLESIQMKAVLNDQREIGEMIGALGSLFRIHTQTFQDLVPLKAELDYVRLYFKLQKMRYEDRIEYVEHIQEGCEEIYVVRFMLQPLVENAIKYGLENLMNKGIVAINAYVKNQCLWVEVIDNGIGMNPDLLADLQTRLFADEHSIESKNIGIRNVHDRIRLHFGPEYGLRIESMPGKGTTITIVIPLSGKMLLNERKV